MQGVETRKYELLPQAGVHEHDNIEYLDCEVEVWEHHSDDYQSISNEAVVIHRVADEVKEQRSVAWPHLIPAASAFAKLDVYNCCRKANTYNLLGPKVPVQMCNNIDAWASLRTGHIDDDWILNCICFGFPLQYRGPPLPSRPVVNHPSATNYHDHVSRYIATELELGALVGPFHLPPFHPWCNVAPLMSRPKHNTLDRRIIVDLSYPIESGPNAFIVKNHLFGATAPHVLPGVQDAVSIIIHYGFQVTLAAIDISRAYRNFPLEPMDWPLTCIAFDDLFYIDVAMPFGSRLSSLYMQRIASYLQRALARQNVIAIIYLDDALIISPRDVDPQDQFQTVINTFRGVGLPIAWAKLVSPTTNLRFLGIIIDVQQKELRIPLEKIRDFVTLASRVCQKPHISKKELQSIIGHINHMGKVVRSARLFMNRLLSVLRSLKGKWVRVDRQLKLDLEWFISLATYNGKSLIIDSIPDKIVYVDSCLTGAGGIMDDQCYSYVYPGKIAEDHHISQLEAVNCLLAARLFLHVINNQCIQIVCDNEAAVTILLTGRGRDEVILAVARAFWLIASNHNINFVFKHAPGKTLEIVDALSREHLSPKDARKARMLVHSNRLTRIFVPLNLCDFEQFL